MSVGPHSHLQSAAQCGGDFNEVTYHIVHVVHSQLALQKGAPVVRGEEGGEWEGSEWGGTPSCSSMDCQLVCVYR